MIQELKVQTEFVLVVVGGSGDIHFLRVAFSSGEGSIGSCAVLCLVATVMLPLLGRFCDMISTVGLEAWFSTLPNSHLVYFFST